MPSIAVHADLDFDGFEATNAADPTAAQSLVTRAYGDANYLNLVAVAQHRRTAGNYTLSSNTWADLDTGTDLAVSAAVGDVIEVSISAVYGNQTQVAYLDVATIVSGAVVHSFGSGELTTTTGDGIQSWAKENATAVFQIIGGSMFYVVQSGDVSGGTVTLRLRYRRGAGNVTLFAQAANVFWWGAKVLR